MKLETRTVPLGNSAEIRRLLLISQNNEESRLIDRVFGDKVADDGLIARGTCEVRLSDGYGEHYISMQPLSWGAAHPKIVTLCGSTRFKEAYEEANYRLTMAGKIVLSVGFYMHAVDNRHGEDVGATPEQKEALDVLHKRKIDMSDEVFVLNVGGYIGESTRSEIEYAKTRGVQVFYLEPISEWDGQSIAYRRLNGFPYERATK